MKKKTVLTVDIKVKDLEEVKEIISELQKKIEIYESELERLYKERYQTPKTVAELVKVRACIYLCSYKTTWENFLDDDEKYNYTYEQIIPYLKY